MAHFVYRTSEGDIKASFQCSVCGEMCDGELYIWPSFPSEKACHVCGPEQDTKFVKVINATFFNF